MSTARQRRQVAVVSVTRRRQLGHVEDIRRLVDDQNTKEAAGICSRQ
ncbi:MAG TPA: hypothetical protein VFH54_09625 [Mycobacteriales bacterium]|nr:hypothetical protein [Mycobacteriales bacterium]